MNTKDVKPSIDGGVYRYTMLNIFLDEGTFFDEFQLFCTSLSSGEVL